jgi:hypothetical protein
MRIFVLFVLISAGFAANCREMTPDNQEDILGYDNYILLEFFHSESILGDTIAEIEETFEIFDLYVFCVDATAHTAFAKELGVASTPAIALFYSEEKFPRAVTTDFTAVEEWLDENLPESTIFEDKT